MNAVNIIKANEIPVDQLLKVGLDEKMLFGLHPKELERMMHGRLSPLFAELSAKDKAGKSVSFSGKIRFVRGADGHVDMMVYPARKRLENEYNLKAEDFERLKKGEPVLVTLEMDKGKQKYFLQCDLQTNVVMSMRQDDLRIPNAVGDIILGDEQQQRYKEGKPIVLEKDDTQVTVGVDLDDPTGCRVLRGDLQQWQKNRLIEWDRRTPDAYGYWQTSENGLQYKSFVEQQKGINNILQQEENVSRGMRR